MNLATALTYLDLLAFLEENGLEIGNLSWSDLNDLDALCPRAWGY